MQLSPDGPDRPGLPGLWCRHAGSRCWRSAPGTPSTSAGWCRTGDERAALWWTQRAVDLAAADDDHALAGYALVRRALVTLPSDEPSFLLTSLQRLAAISAPRHATVHNDINGGIQHGPVIQSGRITGLTFHVHQPPAPNQG
ncbi:hypothetical protein [Streptomyces sp. Ag109_G2-15]|uniref:hypothetical protein n=1 Tax=Streptomyces sp. Ag109_G2-15 TaxID=1938850 RepID=UPI00211C7CA8|nr:hypothetical protein [Streptomyces sp. Ag109_G2-15]